MLLQLFSFLSARDLCIIRCVCKRFLDLSREDVLWKALCEQEFSPIHNKLHTRFGKNWEWLYQSKAVVFTNRKQIRDGQVGCYRNEDNKRREEGEWEGGKFRGYAILILDKGEVYEGQWKDGRLNGFARAAWADGDVYEGEWKDGWRNGEGTKWWANGDKYTGDWQKGKRYGKGTQWYSCGDVYEGHWKDDKREGEKGVMEYSDERKYDGAWVKDLRHGRGVMHWPTNVRYEGSWHMGKIMEGGVVHFGDGSGACSLEEALNRLWSKD
eukprot:TRINITY_DN1747_c0_g1_i4.p1 TRINITY_DN1747_c0_g1~~TRINITY_DN1747_c0_g1_i4.p1  ORF type:complete len:268 (+),score=41.76 TRINITY_DN1747_c0_g1_i4:134-937(+)